MPSGLLFFLYMAEMASKISISKKFSYAPSAVNHLATEFLSYSEWPLRSVHYCNVWNFCWFFCFEFLLEVVSLSIHSIFHQRCSNINFIRMPKINIAVYKGHILFIKKKITHMWRRWGTPKNFFLAFIYELEKQTYNY